MEETTTLRRSSSGLRAQIITTGVLALILALFSDWVLSKLFGWTPNEGGLFVTIAWIVIIGGWAITALRMWFSWKAKRYEINKDAIIVYASAGKWGSSQTLYRYESIISLRMTQGFWGKRFGYGDVRITIPKIDQEVILYDIEEPAKQLAELQARLNERSVGAHALIN